MIVSLPFLVEWALGPLSGDVFPGDRLVVGFVVIDTPIIRGGRQRNVGEM